MSIWNNEYDTFYKGKRLISNRSNSECFSTLCAALGTINQIKLYRNKIQWTVHGLKFKEPTQIKIREHAGPNGIKLSALKDAKSVDELKWKGCQAFLVPDTADREL